MNNEPVAWDRGTWTVGETESQEFIESSDFNHDVRLYLTGDFEDDTQRLNYLKHIADRLNIHPVKELDEDFDAICLENKRLQAEIEKLRSWVEMLVEVPFFNEIDHYRGIPVAILRKASEK